MPVQFILLQSVPTLAVAVIYCLWLRAYLTQRSRLNRLRERVAYMLFVAATETE